MKREGDIESEKGEDKERYVKGKRKESDAKWKGKRDVKGMRKRVMSMG